MAGRATGPAHPAPIMAGRPAPSAGPAPLFAMRDAPQPIRPVLPASTGVRRSFTAGRIGICAIPILAVLAALGLKPSTAFSTDPDAYAQFVAGRWSSPMAVATTTATGVLTLISVVALALLLLGTRGRWLAMVGSGIAAAGSVMMMAAVGSVVVRAQGVAKPIFDWRLDQARITATAHGTDAAVLVFGGAALITLGFVILGLAVMFARGLNRGDGGLLMVSAPMVFLGGFFLHVLPTMGAFLLGAAGLGIVFTADRIAPAIRAVPELIRPARIAAPMSAFAGFTDQDLDELYAFATADPGPAPFLTPAEAAMIAAGYPDDTRLDDPRLNGARLNGVEFAGAGTAQTDPPLNAARRGESWLTRNRRTPAGRADNDSKAGNRPAEGSTAPDQPAKDRPSKDRSAGGRTGGRSRGRTNGTHVDGAHTVGPHLNGVHVDGSHTNGAHLNGTHVNGAHADGARPTRTGGAIGRLSRGISTAWQVRKNSGTKDGSANGSGTSRSAAAPETGSATPSSAAPQREHAPAAAKRSTTMLTTNVAKNKGAGATGNRVKGNNAKGSAVRATGAKVSAGAAKSGRSKNRGAASSGTKTGNGGGKGTSGNGAASGGGTGTARE